MRFRLGYVAMTLSLEDCSPSGTLTYKSFSNLPEGETRVNRLRKITRKNLLNTLRILKYNKAMKIPVYRMTSKLVPLATHPEVADWDYASDFADELKEIGRFIIDNNFRVSAHPDHFTLINSPSEKVFTDSLRDLDYHVRIFEAMGLDDCRYKLVLHVGGVYGKKSDSIERFYENFARLPDRISRRLTIENDDKSYNTYDVLKICQTVGRPMVLDVHHHNCLLEPAELKDIIPDIFKTWNTEPFPPKIHFSSPRSTKDFRSHADYIAFDDFYYFLNIAKEAGKDFDVMLEAKAKDLALLKLSEELASRRDISRTENGDFFI
jgi:UV DNA damage endonuclease